MATMGKYCKAYYAGSFRQYPGWSATLQHLQKNTDRSGSAGASAPLLPVEDEDILYLQDTYVVTDGIFLDEHVVFDDASDDWRRFCQDTLQFSIPDDVLMADAAGEASGGASSPESD
jgi:hypothetical protein